MWVCLSHIFSFPDHPEMDSPKNMVAEEKPENGIPNLQETEKKEKERVAAACEALDQAALTALFGDASSSGERPTQERHTRRPTPPFVMNHEGLEEQMDEEILLRIAETLDAEINLWAAGKDGNLRALLSTLQDVLWPESGWEPVAVSNLITASDVRKVYRKAVFCTHPDKVQQKGGTLHQTLKAHKVFHIVKKSWKEFISEEPLQSAPQSLTC